MKKRKIIFCLSLIISCSSGISIASNQEIVSFNISSKLLVEGDCGTDVLKLNNFLIQEDYLLKNKGKSCFDKDTKRAVISFQELNGLVGDGLVGEKTYLKINKTINVGKEEIKDIEVVENLVETINFNSTNRLLKQGMASEDILTLNRFLRLEGYNEIPSNSIFSSLTKEKVIDFQIKNGLVGDGLIGTQTTNKIKEIIKNRNLNINNMIIEINSNAPVEDWIMINKNNNMLYHMRNKTVIKRYPVATGKDMSLTPEGKFKIVKKLVNPTWGGAGRQKPIKGGLPNNPLGSRWLGINLQGGGVYGVHGNSNPKSISTYASLGCVRMFNEDVEELYENIPQNTPVWIGTSQQLLEYGVQFR